MSTIETSIDIDLPVRAVYNQWTQFEEFPLFMEGVAEVRQVDDQTLHWRAEIGGITREWTAHITRQEPDTAIAWHTEDGAQNDGMVTFEQVSEDSTRVTLVLEFDPEGIAEKVGDVLGLIQRRTEGDLERFKGFIEQRGAETGGWRGQIPQGMPGRRS